MSTNDNSVKRKKSFKSILSKKENINQDQLENLISENKKLQEEKHMFEQINNELKQKLIEKDNEIFVDQANNVVLTNRSYNNLVNNTIESFNKEDICSYIANKYNMKAITNGEYNALKKPIDESYLKSEASHLGFKLLERQEYDYMKSKVEHPDEETIRKTIGNMGLAILSTKEVEHLKNPTKSEMEKKLKSMGFSVINENANLRNSISDLSNQNAMSPPQSNNDSNRNSGLYNLRNTSKSSLNSSRVMASRDFFEQVIKEENSNNDVVLEAGRSLGFVRLSQEQYKKLLDGQKDKIMTKTDIYAGAKDFQLTVLPNDEYKQLLKNKKNSQSMSFDDLNEYAKKFKLKLISVSKDDGDVKRDIDSASSSRRASRIFHVPNGNDSVNDIEPKNWSSQDPKGLSVDRVQEWCKANGFKLSSDQDFKKNVEEFCKQSHQKLVTEEEYQIIKNPSVISLEQVKEYVQQNDLKLLPQSQYDAIKAKKDGKFLADYGTPEIVDHLKSKNPNIHITDKDTILSLNKKVKQLGEKKISPEEAKKVLSDTHHVMTTEELANIKKECMNSLTFKDINKKFPDHTVIHNDDYEELNTKLNKAVLLSQKKKSLKEVHELVEQDFPEHQVIEKQKINDLNEKTKSLKESIASKPTTVEALEAELAKISPEHMIVNKEEMFKALEDNTMTYEDLVNVVNKQYPDLVLAKKDIFKKHEDSMKKLETDVTQSHEKQINTMKVGYDDLIKSLTADILALKSLDSLKEIVETEHPEMALVDKKSFNKAQPKEIEAIGDIERLLTSKYPSMVIVEKEEYTNNLKELATSIQEVEAYKEKSGYLEEQVTNLDKLTKYVKVKHPGNSIVSDEHYSTMSSNLGEIMKEHEEVLNDYKKTTEKHNALVESVNDLPQLKEIVNEKHPGHDIVPLTDEALKEHVSNHHPALSVVESAKLKSIKADHSKAVELLELEKSKMDDARHLEKIIAEKYPGKMLVSKDEHQALAKAASSKPDQSREISSNTISQPSAITEEHLKDPVFVKATANKIGFDVISPADMTDMTKHFAELGKQQIKLDELKNIAEFKYNSHVLTVEELKDLNQKSSTVDLDSLTETANEYGLVLISNEELKELREKAAKIESNTLRKSFNGQGLGIMTNKEVKAVNKEPPVVDMNILKKAAKEQGFVLLSNKEVQELNRKAAGVDLDLLTETANEYGLVLMSNDEVDDLKHKSVSPNDFAHEMTIDEIEDVANEYGLILMSNDEVEKLRSISLASKDATHELTLEEIGDVATKNGLAVIPVDKFDDYQNLDLNREARRNNMVLLSAEEYEDLTNLSIVNDSNYSKTPANLNDLSAEGEHRDVNDDFDFSDPPAAPKVYVNNKSVQKTKAFLRDMEDDTMSSIGRVETQESKVVLAKGVYKDLLERPEMTKELLVQKARDYDMIAIDLQHFAEITTANMKQNMGIQDAMLMLQDRGYISLPGEEYDSIANPTKDEVATMVYNRWNMVLVERNNSLTTRNLQEKQRKTSMNGSRHASLIQVQPPASRSVSNTYNNDSSFTSGASDMDHNKEAAPYLFQPFQQQRKRSLVTQPQEEYNLVDEAKKQNMLLIPERMYLRDLHQIPPHSVSDSYNGLLLVERKQLEELVMNERAKSAAYVANEPSVVHETEVQTVESKGNVQNDKIIVSLTQTVIGEYLYKYYNRFGNMGNKPRHERYFWIHPYTMTLYWSVKNPSKDGQKVTDSGNNHKTKGVGIVGVEVVDDPNPYPPGLYNKSIIIMTSDGKNVKITCPTQQRHKVWLRSLKYLQNAADSKSENGRIMSDQRIVHGFETRGNKRLSISGIRNVSHSYDGFGNNKMTPETEQHPTFFVNSLK